jgi:hypothetical protein
MALQKQNPQLVKKGIRTKYRKCLGYRSNHFHPDFVFDIPFSLSILNLSKIEQVNVENVTGQNKIYLDCFQT